jgi:type II secretory pathway pseudopilin PulG
MFAPRRSPHRAHTLAELLIVVVLTGLLAGIAVNGFANLLPVGREQAAVGKARLINAARSAYALSVPDASSRWTAAADDASRLALLRDARLLEGEPGDYLSSSGGYSLALSGGLRSPTVLSLHGETVGYSR